MKKLKLNKEVIYKLQEQEMSEVNGMGIYATDVHLEDSINTEFTQQKSCCINGECAYASCHVQACAAPSPK